MSENVSTHDCLANAWRPVDVEHATVFRGSVGVGTRFLPSLKIWIQSNPLTCSREGSRDLLKDVAMIEAH